MKTLKCKCKTIHQVRDIKPNTTCSTCHRYLWAQLHKA